MAIGFGLTLTSPVTAGDKENAYLRSYEGTWEGSGKIDFLTRNTQESTKCRFKGTEKSAGALSLSGSCAFSGGKLSLRTTIEYSPSRGQFRAEIKTNINAEIDKNATTGTLSNNKLTFVAPYFDTKTKTPFEARISTDKKPDGFDLQFVLVDRKTGQDLTRAAIPFRKK